MATVTSHNREEFIEKEMARKAGKSDDGFPSYKKGDIAVSHRSGAHVKIHSVDKKNKFYLGHYHDVETGETLKEKENPYIAIEHGPEHSHKYEE